MPGQYEFPQRRRPRPQHPRRGPVRVWGARLAAVASLAGAVAVVLAIVFAATGGSGTRTGDSATQTTKSTTSPAAASRGPKPGTAAVPILAYHVINTAPPLSSAPPSLYVPVDQFSKQMAALKAAGWHAVTLNQLEAYWTRGTSLGRGKPIVITFDDGYASHYTNALPVLKGLGWVGVEDLQTSGLPPSEGGLTGSQVRGLVAAGWELDTEGVSQPDLTVLGSTQLTSELTTARQTLHSLYNVPVNWFCYPSGSYNDTVVAAVRAAGFVGATTHVPGWASPKSDRYRLPRLLVVAGTTPQALLTQIATVQGTTSAPPSFHGP